MFRKLVFTIALIAGAVSSIHASEYQLEGDAKKEFHQMLNSWTGVHTGVVSIHGDYMPTMEFSLGQWIMDGYGVGVTLQMMPGEHISNEGTQRRYSTDYRSLSVLGIWNLYGLGDLEVSMPHRLGAGLLQTIFRPGDVQLREDGFGFVSSGLGLDYLVSNSWEVNLRGEYLFAFGLDEQNFTDLTDLSGPSIKLGFTWYPNSVSEVK